MNSPRPMLAVVFALLLVLSALPAAAVSFNRETCRDRTVNTAGTTQAELTPIATTFCYLSRVNVENTDTSGETAECRVVRGAFVWFLRSILGQSDDANVRCCAICYNN
jgi:hypothetical protein